MVQGFRDSFTGLAFVVNEHTVHIIFRIRIARDLVTYDTAGCVLTHVRLQVVGHGLSQICRDDGWGSLARTQTEVVARASDGQAHEVAEVVDSLQDCGHDDGEYGGGTGALGELSDVEQVRSIVRADGPVVVLP